MLNKTNTVFIRCPHCDHLNISDESFYRVRCSECNEIFINMECTLTLNDRQGEDDQEING